MWEHIDGVKAINDIMSGAVEPPRGERDRERLRNVLNFMKSTVLYQIAQDVVMGDPQIATDIESARQTLEANLAKVQTEIETTENSQNGSSSLARYKKEKLEQMRGKLDSLIGKIESPEEFVRTLLTDYDKTYSNDPLSKQANDEARKTTYSNILMFCVGSMQDDRTAVESARVGESMDPVTGYVKPGAPEDVRRYYRALVEYTGDLLPNYGANLFHKVGGKYVPNIEAVQNFLELIRNPELLDELTEHCSACKKKIDITQKIETAKQELETQNEIRDALSNEETRGQVESYLESVVAARNAFSEADNALNKARSSIDRPRNFLQRGFYWLSGEKKKDEQAREQAKNDYIEKRNARLAIEDAHNENINNNPAYASVYREYLLAAKEGENDRADKKELEARLVEDKCTKQTQTIYEVISPKVNIDERVAKAQSSYDEASAPLPEAQRNAEDAFEQLSPRAKELVEKTPRGYVRTDGLRETYIDRTVTAPHLTSRYVASLVMETMLDFENIQTEEQVQAYGISFTDEDIANQEKATAAMKKYVDRQLVKILEQGKEVMDPMDNR